MQEENDKQKELRKKISKIKSKNLPKEAETKLIQGQFYKSETIDETDNNRINEGEGFSKKELQKTYYCKEKNQLGCEHYYRNAKILAECCKKLYPCRLCHNQKESHQIDRFAIKFMMCMSCDKNEQQEIGQECKYCYSKIAEYCCLICNQLSSSVDRPLFHCEKCGLCRVGERELCFHCDYCETCFDNEAINMHSKEKCKRVKEQTICPCCKEDESLSTKALIILPCGHSLHNDCYAKQAETQYQCPICKKSMVNMNNFWLKLDDDLKTHTMPEEYKDWQSYVYCNDCEKKSWTTYHFMYHKCDSCNGYNTNVLETKVEKSEINV